MAEGKPGRGSDQFPLRLPDGMRERIKRAADDNGRSMNSEIVARLDLTFEQFFEYNAMGMGAFAKRLEASLEISENLFQKMALELVLAGGVAFEDDKPISEAIEKAAADTGLTKAATARLALSEWLEQKGYLQRGRKGSPKP